jgi:hypothetical protein
VNTAGVRFDGEVLRLTEKHGLLRKDEYEEHAEIYRKLFYAKVTFEQSLEPPASKPDSGNAKRAK